MKRWLGFMSGVACGLVLVATCGGVGGKGGSDGGIVEDLATSLHDLLGVDLGVQDAAAAPPLAGNCDKVWIVNPGTPNRIEYFYSEFAVPGFDPTQPQHTTALVCEPTFTGTYEVFFGCSGTTTCDPPLSGNCKGGIIGSAGLGIVRVFCGYQQYSNSSLIAVNKWGKAYLKVGP